MAVSPLLVARPAADSALGVADPHQASEGEGVAVDFNSRVGQYRKSHGHVCRSSVTVAPHLPDSTRRWPCSTVPRGRIETARQSSSRPHERHNPANLRANGRMFWISRLAIGFPGWVTWATHADADWHSAWPTFVQLSVADSRRNTMTLCSAPRFQRCAPHLVGSVS